VVRDATDERRRFDYLETRPDVDPRAAMVLAKEAKVFSSEEQCKSAISGPAKKAIAGFLKASLGSILPASALSTLQ
jgi:hypothetical protein